MSLIDKMRTDEITPLELADEILALYGRQDYHAMGALFEAYCAYRGATRKTKEVAKADLDIIANIADETRALGSPEAAAVAIREGFSTEIGPVRTFYRMAVVYDPEKSMR